MKLFLTPTAATLAGILMIAAFSGCQHDQLPTAPPPMSTIKHEVKTRLADFQATANFDALSEAADLIESAELAPGASPTEAKTFRGEKLDLWLAVLNAIDAKLEADFDFSDVPSLSVSPPPEAGVPTGVDPASITNAALRAQYEQAIKLNQQKAARYALQKGLHKFNRRATAWTEAYIRGSYTGSRDDSLALHKALDEGVANSRRRESLRALIPTLPGREGGVR